MISRRIAGSSEGEQVSVGELTFDILHCPGHSPGSVVFFNKDMRFAHVGDVLFNGSVGRSDIPGGDHATLIKSITDKLLPLGDDVGFICGHGAGLQHRPGADDQSVSHRRDVTWAGQGVERRGSKVEATALSKSFRFAQS